MSKNMKELYQSYADSIVPAPDMEARLKRQLYAEMQKKQSAKRKTGMKHFSRWLIAACMLFLVSGGSLTYVVTQVAGQTGRECWIVGENINENQMFGQKNVANTDMEQYSEAEKPWVLHEMLQLDSVMVICDYADENGSRKRTRMSEAEIQSVCDRLQDATICEENVDIHALKGSETHYQVLIQYKPFIKFTVYDGMYLQIEDGTTIYKINN